MLVKNSLWFGAEDTEAFKAYLATIDRGERRAIRLAKWWVVGAFAVLATVALLMNGNYN